MGLSGAERQRRYRDRKIVGVQCVRVDVDQRMVETLLLKRVLSVDKAGDPEAIARAIQELIDRGAADRIAKLFGPPRRGGQSRSS